MFLGVCGLAAGRGACLGRLDWTVLQSVSLSSPPPLRNPIPQSPMAIRISARSCAVVGNKLYHARPSHTLSHTHTHTHTHRHTLTQREAYVKRKRSPLQSNTHTPLCTYNHKRCPAHPTHTHTQTHTHTPGRHTSLVEGMCFQLCADAQV